MSALREAAASRRKPPQAAALGQLGQLGQLGRKPPRPVDQLGRKPGNRPAGFADQPEAARSDSQRIDVKPCHFSTYAVEH